MKELVLDGLKDYNAEKILSEDTNNHVNKCVFFCESISIILQTTRCTDFFFCESISIILRCPEIFLYFLSYDRYVW